MRLSGLYKPTSGTIRINGEVVDFHSPRDAIAAGIGMVHQHFMLVPTQTVTENILLGLREPRFFMNLADYDQQILALARTIWAARGSAGPRSGSCRSASSSGLKF